MQKDINYVIAMVFIDMIEYLGVRVLATIGSILTVWLIINKEEIILNLLR